MFFNQRGFFLFTFLVLGTIPLNTWARHSYRPKDGVIPNKEMAMKIAEIILNSVYGEKTIAEEKPLNVTLKNNVWIVEGTLAKKWMLGGVAAIEIAKDDGCVIRISHGK
jgi:hypothetical protein